MTILNDCLLASIPLYALLVSRLKGRAQDVVFGAYFWAIAAVEAVSTWHFYTTWRRLAPLSSNSPTQTAESTHLLWFNLTLIVVLLVTPIVLYARQRRKGRLQALPPPVPEEAVWPPAPIR